MKPNYIILSLSLALGVMSAPIHVANVEVVRGRDALPQDLQQFSTLDNEILKRRGALPQDFNSAFSSLMDEVLARRDILPVANVEAIEGREAFPQHFASPFSTLVDEILEDREAVPQDSNAQVQFSTLEDKLL